MLLCFELDCKSFEPAVSAPSDEFELFISCECFWWLLLLLLPLLAFGTNPIPPLNTLFVVVEFVEVDKRVVVADGEVC